MSMTFVILLSVLIVAFYFIFFKNRATSNDHTKQRDFALIFLHFISKRKKEIFTNEFDHSIWKEEMEVGILLVEAKKMNLFPDEVLKKLAPYTHLEMFLNIENEIARKEIIELESYFNNI